MRHFVFLFANLFLVSFTGISTAQSAANEELIESICEEKKEIEFRGISMGMTVAELEGLSTNTPKYVSKNIGRLEFGENETLQWFTYGTGRADVKDLVIYKINYWRDYSRDWEWIEKNSVDIYNAIIDANGDPTEQMAPSRRGWFINYGREAGSVVAPGGPWMTFVEACKAEGGSTPELSRNISAMLQIVFPVVEASAALESQCPNAMGNEYMAFLRHHLQPSVTFQLSNNTLSMNAKCFAMEKWQQIENYRNQERMVVVAEDSVPLTEEAKRVIDECQKSSYQRIYLRCDCMAQEFMKRRAKNPDTPWNNIYVVMHDVCFDGDGAAEHHYEQCMALPPNRLPQNKEPEEFCQCIADKWRTEFGGYKGQMTSRIRAGIQAKANMQCQR